jgi:uncharacterized protein (DUF1778 family)
MSASVSLSLRISPTDRNLIDRAASVTNKSRSEFLLESARSAATDALLDQRLFMLAPSELKAFEKAMKKAPSLNDVAKSLKKRQSPWEA